MKGMIMPAAMILLIILTTITLQGCFTPYPERGDPEREWRDRQIWEEMRRNY